MDRRNNRNAYHDKLSWTRTLILVGIAMLLFYCIYLAFKPGPVTAAYNGDATSFCNYDSRLLLETGGVDNGVLVEYDHFIVNFNPELHIPNWVAWELTANETYGTGKRGKFQRDPDVDGCPTTQDYTGSGYDRGHMAPAADMKWNDAAMEQCFYMTNICPQSHLLNGGAWKKLEEKCRAWARADSAILIICGPILTPRPDEFIGESEVAVPKSFFKVICSPYINEPRAIGFIMTNGKIEGGLQAAAVSVDSVERITGLDFFAALPDSIENAIEKECRFHFWSTIK